MIAGGEYFWLIPKGDLQNGWYVIDLVQDGKRYSQLEYASH
ncbi:MAG: hypothetical protein AAF193_06605 [Bacteroidota bacterium]